MFPSSELEDRTLPAAVFWGNAVRNERLWFGPVLVFPLGSRLAAVEVRVWPWLTIHSFHLLVEDEVVDAEGLRHRPCRPHRSLCNIQATAPR
jgi:hypothetical protein